MDIEVTIEQRNEPKEESMIPTADSNADRDTFNPQPLRCNKCGEAWDVETPGYFDNVDYADSSTTPWSLNGCISCLSPESIEPI